jgi:hypothetical protein
MACESKPKLCIYMLSLSIKLPIAIKEMIIAGTWPNAM